MQTLIISKYSWRTCGTRCASLSRLVCSLAVRISLLDDGRDLILPLGCNQILEVQRKAAKRQRQLCQQRMRIREMQKQRTPLHTLIETHNDTRGLPTIQPKFEQPIPTHGGATKDREECKRL